MNMRRTPHGKVITQTHFFTYRVFYSWWFLWPEKRSVIRQLVHSTSEFLMLVWMGIV